MAAVITINAEQVQALGDAARERTLAWLQAHVQQHFPGVVAASGAGAVKAFVAHCADDAGRLQLDSQRAHLCLLSLKLYFGCGFAADPQCQGFAAILLREDVATPDARIERAWREGMQWHDLMAGEADMHATAALQRLAGLGLARTVAEAAPLDAAGATSLLAGLWPQKHALLVAEQPAALEQLMRGVAQTAQALGVQQRGQVRAMLALAYVLGSGFAQDPLLRALHPLAQAPGPDAKDLAAAERFVAQWATPTPMPMPTPTPASAPAGA